MIVAVASPVKCADRCSAPPVPSAVSFSVSSSAVAPRGAAPSLSLVGCSVVFRAVAGFSSPPPGPVRPPPIGNGTLWGLPGFHFPWVPHLLWGLIRPMTTRLPLRFLLESSHPAMNRPLLPLHWGSSQPGTIQPSRPLCGGSSRLEMIPPSLPLLGGPSRSFPPLRRPHGPPPPISLCGDWGPLWMPCGRHSFLPFPRVHLPPILTAFLFPPCSLLTPWCPGVSPSLAVT